MTVRLVEREKLRVYEESSLTRLLRVRLTHHLAIYGNDGADGHLA